jgi:hypothetical protein
MRPETLLFSCSIGLATTPLSAETAQDRYALAWVRGSGAEDCPSATELQREVDRRVGRAVFDPAAARSIEVAVRRDEPSVAGTASSRRSEIHVRNGDGIIMGQRALSSDEPDCRSLFSSTALAIALLVDPEATERREGHAEQSAATTMPGARVAQPAAANGEVAAPAIARRTAVAAPPPTQEEPRVTEPTATSAKPQAAERFAQLGVNALETTSILPRTALGVSIALRVWESTNVGWSLSTLYVPSQEAPSVDDASVAVGLSAIQPAVMLGYAPSASVRAVVDLGGTLGALHYAARGGSTIGTNERWFLAARAELGLQLELSSRVFAEAGAAGSVPILRARMVDERQRSVLFLQPAIGAMGRIGVGIRIP